MITKLRPKQQAFVREYLVDFNATQAAIRAGYSERTAKEIAYENLTKPHIATAIEQAIGAQSERTEIDADWVQAKLVEIVERAMESVPVLYKGEPTANMEFGGGVATSALAVLAKRTGGFAEPRSPLDYVPGDNVKSFELRVVYDTDPVSAPVVLEARAECRWRSA